MVSKKEALKPKVWVCAFAEAEYHFYLVLSEAKTSRGCMRKYLYMHVRMCASEGVKK